MLKICCIVLALCFLCIAPLAFSSAAAFEIELSPKKLYPGDPFILKVKGALTQPLQAILNGKSFPLASCGEHCFMLIGAVDIEAKPGNYPLQLLAEGNKKDIALVVGDPKFVVVNLTLADDKVSLSPEALERVTRENERLNALFATLSDRLWEEGFASPLHNDISTPFGVKRIINKKITSFHRGIDIRGKAGTEVKAANKGRVVLAEELFLGGNTIILDHGQGIYTLYMHLSQFNVKPGDLVSKGDVIGLVGSTGRSNGPHLHFGVKVLSISTNPLSFLELQF